MNAHRTLLAVLVTAVAGLSVACSAAPGEGVGQTDEAVKNCTGQLVCPGGPGSGGVAGPGQVVDCTVGPDLTKGNSNPTINTFEAALIKLGCTPNATMLKESGLGQPALIGTSCPMNGARWLTGCPSAGGPDGGVLEYLTIDMLVACYSSTSPVDSSRSMLNGSPVNPCTLNADGNFWVEFDPTCSGRTCVGGGPGGPPGTNQ